MMAEYTYQHKENNLGDETVRASNVQYHSQWIKRWTRETTKAVPRNHQCFAVSSSSKAKAAVHEEVKYLQVDTLESRKLKTLKSVMNQGSVSEYKKLYRFGFSNVALPVEVQQSAESSYRTIQISHAVQFASEEHHFEAQTNTKCLNQDMQPHIAVQGSSSCVDDIEGSTAQWQIGKCEKQKQAVNLTKLMTSSRLSSGVSMENFCTWIQRWCCKNTQKNKAVAAATPFSCEAAKSHLTHRHEAMKQQQLPSLAAMALVGRVIKQFHTCVFHRVGSSAVWNIEPF